MQAEIAARPTAPLDVGPGSSEAVLYWNRSLARRSLFLVWGIDVVYTQSMTIEEVTLLSHHRLEGKLNFLSRCSDHVPLFSCWKPVAIVPSRAIVGDGVVGICSARAGMSLIGWQIQLKVMLKLMPKEGSQKPT
ncbi:unnamed protein product [Fusarium venenatum]|uniref:Uncharacterized protein n=1 Tax=Fusarium venenatum TaxID=56646 RepID=A0A2L2T5R4_9HYPO|nr:uncharacterized protein FVRRES_11949 [Fusarium venenatum]CEI39258.1 unnamed protein product [Fusarium venenatum]